MKTVVYVLDMHTTLVPLLSPQDVALLLGLPSAKVIKLARKGQIPCVIVPPDEIRFDAAVLKSWMERLPSNQGVGDAN